MIDVAKLPRELPAEPTGWTRSMVGHINMGRRGHVGQYVIRDPNGTEMPFMYAYNTGAQTRGFYLVGSDDCLSWRELRKRWPAFVKVLERLQAAGKDERWLAGAPLPMVVIYDRPKDAPEGFVVRSWSVFRGIVAHCKLLGSALPSLDAARELVPREMINIGRQDSDDPVIAEVWL